MSESNLSSLVVRAQTGDRAAYDDIVLRFQDMAVGYASALLGDFHLAEDAAQEAFVGAWTELPRLHEPAAFPGWFKRIVFMRCSRVLRKRQPVAIEHAAAESLVTAKSHMAAESLVTADPGEELESREEKTRVMGAIGRLPDEERMAVVLYYISTYSHREVGSFLGLSASTVNNRLRSARKRLRREMLKEERGFNSVQALLEAAMQERFGYDPAFTRLAEAIKSRDRTRIEVELAARAELINASDALGNGPLHWAVITRQNDLVDIFVARGASLEARRADGQTPLLVSLNGDYWFRSRDLPSEA
ncbi:MAG: sigma-70 family RNA polymerase sigma factor, partial [candidate division Zixibacteria bacterium]|nr:sigma-70 family RNA polymerase sigma factor [candidate division Zixibacteria bacterium]